MYSSGMDPQWFHVWIGDFYCHPGRPTKLPIQSIVKQTKSAKKSHDLHQRRGQQTVVLFSSCIEDSHDKFISQQGRLIPFPVQTLELEQEPVATVTITVRQRSRLLQATRCGCAAKEYPEIADGLTPSRDVSGDHPHIHFHVRHCLRCDKVDFIGRGVEIRDRDERPIGLILRVAAYEPPAVVRVVVVVVVDLHAEAFREDVLPCELDQEDGAVDRGHDHLAGAAVPSFAALALLSAIRLIDACAVYAVEGVARVGDSRSGEEGETA